MSPSDVQEGPFGNHFQMNKMMAIGVFVMMMPFLSCVDSTLVEMYFKHLGTNLTVRGVQGRSYSSQLLFCSASCIFDAECVAYQYDPTINYCETMHLPLQNSDVLTPTENSELHVKECLAPWVRYFPAEIPQPIYYTEFDESACLTLHNGAKVENGKLTTDIQYSQWAELGDLSAACITVPDTCTQGGAGAAWVRHSFTPGDVNGLFGSQAIGKAGLSFQSNGNQIAYYLYMENIVYNIQTTLPTNWFHLVFIFHGPQEGITLYVNGVVIEKTTESDLNSDSPGIGVLIVGARMKGLNAMYSSVEMDELMFWNQELTGENVGDLYNGNTLD